MKKFFELLTEAMKGMDTDDKVTVTGIAAVVAMVLGRRIKKDKKKGDD